MLLQKSKSVLMTFVRNHMKKRKVVGEGGIEYYGFTYFPRFPGQKDPPYIPQKLFLVKRIKPVKGNPYWDVDILKHFKLDGKDHAIVKNEPETNKKLWRIKHLIKIIPITMPDGEPTEENINGCHLNLVTGELRISPLLKVDERRIVESQQFQYDARKLDGMTIKNHYCKLWNDPVDLKFSDF